MTTTSEKIAIAKANIDSIEAVKNSLKAKFSIDDNVPFAQYPDKIYPNVNNETAFYKADSYYYDPYIPAHSNIEISGSPTPSDLVGLWQNQNPFGQGFARSWKNGTYALQYSSGGEYDTASHWVIRNAASQYEERYYTARIFNSTESGDSSNPKIWNNMTLNGDATITNKRDISSANYIWLRLKAGTAYKIGTILDTSNGNTEWVTHQLYDESSSYGEAIAYGESTETVNGHECTNVISYTPSAEGVYKLYCYADYSGDVKVQQVCYPAPEVWVPPSENPWDYTFQSQWGGGQITLTEIPVAEHQATKTWAGYQMYKNTTDGKTTYSFSGILTEGLTWERFAPNKGEVFSADAMLKLGYIDDGLVYPADATVWAVIIPNDNYQMWINVGTVGGGNFIVWGDGDQTPVDSSGWNVNSSTWSANARFSHTYAKAGQYTVQVIGSAVQRIRVFSNSSGSEAVTNSVVTELIQLSASLSDATHMFNGCSGLTKIADTVQFPLGLGGSGSMFKHCSELVYAPSSLRWQPSMDMSETFYGCFKLSADITHWFDNLVFGGNSGKRVYRTFDSCKMMKGKVPADKLWADGSWFLNGGSVTTPFIFCTGLSNFNEIPTPWK